ncbi:MAG TPA: hypothetical protein VEL79_20405 [Vicinamibacterales bacterium]|nr:hypothetical protein [Vicinamibacterales bacterium]
MSRMVACVIAALLLAPGARAQEPRADGWVVLPIDEYRALRARAFPAVPDPAPPPIDATLTRVDYDLRIAGETISGQARLTIDVLKQGWAAVQVPAGILVRDAKIDGRPTALIEGNPPRILISRLGRSALTLDIVVPLVAAAGTESMTLPASASALSAVTLVVPKTGVDLSVTGGFIAEQTETGNDSRWVVYGNPGRLLSFTWKRRTDDRRAAMPLRTRARVTQFVALGEDTTQITSSIQLDVTQGVARAIAVALPAGLIVNQVAGATVADWNVDRNTLTVTFLDPVAAQTSIVISSEARGPREGAVPVPLVRVPSAERETGGVAVDVVGPGEIAGREPRGLEPADPADLGDIIAGRESPSMVAFQFTPMSGSAPRSLTVSVSRYTPQAVLIANIEEARYDALLGEDGKLLVRARYAVRNNQRSFLAVTLPAQSTLWSASLAGQPVRPGVSSTGGLLLPLRKGRSNEEAPTFVVELLYLQRAAAWIEKGDARLELPAVDLPVSRTGLTLHHSPRYLVDARPGVFRPETDPGPWSNALREGGQAAVPLGAPAQALADKDAKSLIDRFQKEAGRTRAGVVPIAITFPAIGPSVFLAAELTPDAVSPSLDIQYHRTGGR